ncbi:MAG TPA: hypothetical protein VMQ11_12055 [Alphaproteobacteria bacterium]|nr:hypothetical protein [Alphaproteobacteria bacterium]
MSTREIWTLANEFAQVRLSLDREGHAPRLRIEDAQTGMAICLDPLVLAGLVWASDDELAVHVDPDAPHRPA